MKFGFSNRRNSSRYITTMNTNTGDNMYTNMGGNMNTNMGGNMNTNMGGNMNTNMGGNMNTNMRGNMNTNMGGRCSSGGSYDGELIDRGNEPIMLNLQKVSRQNDKRLRVLWTGENMQMTVMAIPTGSELGLEVHENNDQLVIVDDGVCEVYMGNAKDRLTMRAVVDGGYGVIVPAGTYHNLKNVGKGTLRLVSVYAPKEHPYGTVE